MESYSEIAAGVHVLRHPVLDVNTTLVVGDGAALVVDTLSTADHARELLEAARRITPHPLQVVNTHHHFDHCFGNATLMAAGATGIWAHEAAAAWLRNHGTRLRREAYATYATAEPELAAALLAVTVQPPTRTVRMSATLDIGGRQVELRHLGRGHTAGDLVVLVPDAAVVVAGDLVEESRPPAFGDAFPLEWPTTLATLLHHCHGPVVPGHGRVVDAAYVQAQHEVLTGLSWLIREAHADGFPADAVARRTSFDAATARAAARRGFAELDGRA